MISFRKFVKELDLTVLYAPPGLKEIAIENADTNRPGLQFSGFFDYFANDRIQIIGKAEMTYYLEIPLEERTKRLHAYMAHGLPCIVICRNMACPDEMLECAKQYGIPLFSSKQVTTRFAASAISFINYALAPQVTRHGVLIDVDGVGVLLTGESGIGKSESAMEVVKRGHRLVADDVVEIKKVNENRLVGQAPETIRHFMEIRGIGLINVREMYGVSAIINSKSIDMNIHMELWDRNKSYARLGMEDDFINILGVQVPKIVVPVRPGRNLAIVIEVAARNFRLKGLGYNSEKELEKRIAQMMAEAEAEALGQID